jgi:hypothetical protein
MKQRAAHIVEKSSTSSTLLPSHRLCGIVLCESCFSTALVDYHSSPLVGRTPPCCPSCHHSLIEENLNLALPSLRGAVRDSLSFLPSQTWRPEPERQQAPQVLDFSTPQGFGHVYEPILFGGKNAIGEEFMIFPDGARRASSTRAPAYTIPATATRGQRPQRDHGAGSRRVEAMAGGAKRLT